MDISTLQLQKLDKAGLENLISWARNEGWDPGFYDSDVFWATDPDGFYGYFNEDEMIAGGSVVSYSGLFGFMGFFIVKAQYRSAGIGRQLWYQRRDTLLSRLKPGASIGMDGVVAMQPFYKKGGFEIAFRDERHERVGESCNVDNRVSRITDADFDSVLQYDTQCFGFPRPQFLRPWLAQPGSHAFRFADGGVLTGFAMLRKTGRGYKVGPLFADDLQVAEELYKACLNAVPGSSVYLDIPVANHEVLTLAKKYNTTYVFECARMYYGNPPDLPISKIFGVTTFELG